MSVFTCPYCSNGIPQDKTYRKTIYASYESDPHRGIGSSSPSCLRITFYKCPNCDRFTVTALGLGEAVQNVNMYILPKSAARQFPEYVPETIRQDYEEAYSIVNLSPKASATLARRCLQSMINDFWGIRKNNLADSIKELKNLVSAEQWSVINAVRQLGNIGAHMEKDINLIVNIDPDEAEKLLILIEYLIIQWYVERNDRNCLFNDILNIASDKENQRKNQSES